MEIVSAVVSPVVESLMIPIKKHLGYLISCTNYVQEMGTKMRDLDVARLNVEEHVNWNKSNNLEVPTVAKGWLEEVVKIDAQVESIPRDADSCFNLKHRYKLRRKALKIVQDIERLIEEISKINWDDHPIPLGKVGSMKASTSKPSSHHIDFPSRERTFRKALKALEPDHKSHMIALCGMGGVGKTTMMEKLKKFVSDKKMFSMIVKVVIGVEANTITIQDVVADYLGITLTERAKATRAYKLRKRFEALSDGGKNKILVVLDDVCELVDLNDIGLSPLPNQGVDFKVLLTSRNRNVCIMMGVEVDSILNLDVIDDLEAKSFFRHLANISDDADPDLCKIGDDIVSRSHGLPVAIKIIASALKGQSKHVWEDTLSSLMFNDSKDGVHHVLERSYNHLENEDAKSALLLCGLYHEDLDIPREELVRYGWGLKLFNNVYTIREARNRLNKCLDQLIHANLLIQSQDVGCVKMHDLVRDFALDMYSKVEHASIFGNMSKWPAKDTSESCTRISITCSGMNEFPKDRKYPNLLLLKLMHGDKSLKFPEDFCEEMRKLEVIAYDLMECPLLSRSLQCSTNLRTLCLHQCSLMFDCSSIGNLLNLEVLSFAHCSIRELPSTIGNLMELKLLDLTGCVDLCIDDGVLKNLVKLEELYMRVANEKSIRFTDNNRNELAERLKNLFALEIDFFDNNRLPKDMSFAKLERFKISLGCYLRENNGQNKHSFENTLMLVTDKCELLDSGMYELFEKTEVLHFHVDGINDFGDVLADDINDLGDVSMESLHHNRSSFYNLRVLEVCECSNLRYLFTDHVANGLTKLERLTVSFCPVLETLINGDNGGVGVIKFQALRFLSLGQLPKLTSLCNAVNVIELPQLEEFILYNLPNFTSIYPDNNKSSTSSMSADISGMQPFFNKQVVISQLKILKIFHMNKLKEIWPSEFGDSEEVGVSELKVITVQGCDSLVNLFPINPMSLLHYLEEVKVWNCGSIEVLFNIDMESCVQEIIKEGINKLRYIEARGLGNLREVWRMKGVNNSNILILGFQGVENIEIIRCKNLRNVFTPTTIDFDLRSLVKFTIDGIDGWGENKSNGEMVESSQKEEKEINVISNRDISEVDDNIPTAAFPSYLIHIFDHLHTLCLRRYKGVEVVFEIDSSSSRNNQQKLLLPYLKDLELYGMERMTHVWKCNWNKLLISQQQPQSSFANLTNITLDKCIQIKYVFSPLMAKLLYNLKSVRINSCDAMEEVVSNIDDEDEEMVTSISSHTNTNFVPNLDMLCLQDLRCLKRIDGVNITITAPVDDRLQEYSQVGVAYWSMCQHLRRINIMNCDVLLNVIPTHAIRQQQKLEEMEIYGCPSMEEIFEIKGVINNNMIFLPNLTILRIECCDLLENIFTSSTLESLRQLKELIIKSCNGIQVIVKEENEEPTIASKVVVFPRLKSLSLADLPNLKGFFLGKNEFMWPLLDKFEIYSCPQMTTFTYGRSIAPKLRFIHTRFGKHTLEGGLNFDWTSASYELLILQENLKKMEEDHQAREAERRARVTKWAAWEAELESQLQAERAMHAADLEAGRRARVAERAEQAALAAKTAELEARPKVLEEYIRRFPPPPN